MNQLEYYKPRIITFGEGVCTHLDKFAQIRGSANLAELSALEPHLAYSGIYLAWHRAGYMSNVLLELRDIDLSNDPLQFKASREEDARAISTLMHELVPPLLSVTEPFWLIVESFKRQRIFDKLRGRPAIAPSIRASFLVAPFEL